jgi:hypothetical protein
MQTSFNGLGMSLGNLWRLSDARTRSISPENRSGEKGMAAMATSGPAWNAARDLGPGWKVSPFLLIGPHDTVTLADIDGPGALQHIWLTGSCAQKYRRLTIFRIYWDDQETPAVECPIGDFFAAGWGGYAQVSSLPVAVNPDCGFNCYWEMPFHKRCRMTLENLADEQTSCYYQVDYTLTDVPDDAAYFHAQFRRVNPLPYKDVYTILDGVKGKGHYVGTYLAVGVTNNGWWGEGEIKFYIDGDNPHPTIAGTGTEDYFGGAYDWDVNGQYVTYTTPFLGMHQVVRSDGMYKSQMRFAMYRWHIMDPVRFDSDLRVTIQALGWRMGGRYLPLQPDMNSVAYWYQTLPAAPFPALPDRDGLEII